MIKGRLLVTAAFSLLLSLDAFAASNKRTGGPCRNNINLPSHVIYKSTNEHGGRGPSMITSYGNTGQWPPCGSVNIYNKDGALIGRFGCYDSGHLPYGRRYYTGVPGGSYTNASGLYNGARRAGTTNIFIDQSGTRRGTCWIVNSPYSRQGAL